MIYLPKQVILIFMLVSGLLLSQNNEKEKIDILLKSSTDNLEYNGIKSLEYSKKASLIAEEIEDSERKTKSYLIIAKSLYNLDMYKESLTYIEKGLNEKYTNNDVLLEASLKEFKAYNYFSLYLDDQALEEYKSVINLVSKRTDTESYKILSRIYASIGLMYALKNTNKTANYYINKALKNYQKVPVNKVEKFDLSGLYIVKGRICLTDKKTDSAFYYIEKGYDFVKDDKKHSNYRQLSALADFYYTTKQYSKALDYYLKVIDDMEKFNIKNANYLIEIYPTIAELYKKLDDSENQKLFLDKYRKESEQFQKKNTESVQVVINSILNQKNKDVLFINKRSNVLISLSVIIAVIISVLFYIIYKKLNRKRKKTMGELAVKDAMIIEKDEHEKQLKLKVNETFSEIIALAKENHPNLYTRFLEVYPDFQKKLLSINNNLQTSELVLLCYVYLNFETKEIAEYTFKSPKTIQNRKHLLRKKLGISSSEDFYIWLKTNIN
ncbi:hypothetical protein [Chryseobacterium limigenitum]|uniref:Regulatory protein, luxR family n=1 Tax=Chryseobacterium limigenitum TaxID=1612149 RepID=A0A1K2IXJ4_9FLAO|nr:hypothetical protein [Chryseobacterium limigenitum]SFZ97071.1 hypothetical protein SAMN05216324_1382 [Chryseobacterium limigenitum]